MSTSTGPRFARTHPLLGVAGYAQSGKDTAATYLAERGWIRAGFADALRAFALAINPVIPVPFRARITLARKHPGGSAARLRTLARRYVRLADLIDTFGWDVAKVVVPEIRPFMQRVGTEGGRKVLGGDIWVRALIDHLPDAPVVITDVRFANEADAIEAAGGTVIRIVRPGTGPVNDHPSETELDRRQFAAVIANDGTIPALHAAVARLVDTTPEEMPDAA